LAVKEKAYQG